MNGAGQDADTIDVAVADFLQKKGTLEMVVRIGEHGSQRNTDLREELLLSSSTIQQRLKTGKNRASGNRPSKTRTTLQSKCTD